MTDKPRYPTPTEQAVMDARPGKPDASGASERWVNMPEGWRPSPDKQQQRHDYSDVLEAQAKIAEQKGHGGWAINMRQAARYLDAQAAEIATAVDYERARACVNACAGIPTEALEGGALERLIMSMGHLAYELGQYADGAEDAHYLAKEMANFEAEANAALAPFLKGTSDEQ